jgi:hypothetical protein
LDLYRRQTAGWTDCRIRHHGQQVRGTERSRSGLALWEGWFGYDRKKYAAMLREAFEPFALCLPKTAEQNPLNDSLSEQELKRFPLFAALALPSPVKSLICSCSTPSTQDPLDLQNLTFHR